MKNIKYKTFRSFLNDSPLRADIEKYYIDFKESGMSFKYWAKSIEKNAEQKALDHAKRIIMSKPKRKDFDNPDALDVEAVSRKIDKILNDEKDLLTFVSFFNCYNNNVGYDYVMTENFLNKIDFAKQYDLDIENFDFPEDCFFINLETADEHISKKLMRRVINRFDERPEIISKFKDYNVNTRQELINISIAQLAQSTMIGVICQKLTDIPSDGYLSIPKNAITTRNEEGKIDVFLLDFIYYSFIRDEIETWPLYFVPFQNMKSEQDNRMFKSFFDAELLMNQYRILGEWDRLVTTFGGDITAMKLLESFSYVCYMILYLNTIGDQAILNAISEEILAYNPRNKFIKVTKNKKKKKLNLPLVQSEYKVKYVGIDGFPEEWNIPYFEIPEKNAEEIVNESANRRERRSPEYLEPHTRRGYYKRIWVTEKHPEYGNAIAYEEKSFRGINKIRGLVEVWIDETEVNPDRPSKYSSIIKKVF